MNLVISDSNGNPLEQTEDFALDLEYGDACEFELTLPKILEPHFQVHIDGTPFGGIVDKRCPSHTSKGSTIKYKGRSFQGILACKIIMPPSGQSHYSFTGEANTMLGELIDMLDLGDFFTASESDSGIRIDYRFNRFVDAWSGIRMALASQGSRLRLVCQDGRHELSAVLCKTYGSLDSERVCFSLDGDDLPVNHLIGLGKGAGSARAVSHWYADLLGEVSQNQTLFGVWEHALTCSFGGDDASSLPAKVRAKLVEYQKGSAAKVSVPEGVSLDVGDLVKLSSATYSIEATTQVVSVVFKHKNGVGKTSYEFGIPDYPDDEA